ncbi:hypothetical protein [Streptomyces aurantiogriseus]
MSVFTRDHDGAIRHPTPPTPAWATTSPSAASISARPAPPDLTPQGRGDWYPSLDY